LNVIGNIDLSHLNQESVYRDYQFITMNKLYNSEAEQIKEIREIANKLIYDKKLKRNKLASYLGLDKRQYSSFYKFTNGESFPKFLEAISGKVLDKFRELLENPELLQKIKEPWVNEENSGFGISPGSSLAWIPFDLKLPVAEYKGINPPLSVIEMGNKKGIVAFRNSSKFESDGEIYIDTIGMATDIEPGMRVAIKRINKVDWQTDRYYVIIDASGQISIRELLPGDNKKTIKYISTSAPEGPHMELSLDRIVAMFCIVDGTYIPRPKRNTVIAATTQQ
jgi:hypothetical protein